MKLKLFLPVITLTLASIGLIQAQNTAEDKVPKYNLKEAQTYALDHNQSLKNKKLEKRKAEEEVTQTLSQGLPQVSGEIRGRHNFDVRTNVITFGLPGQEPQKSEVRFGTNYRSQASINFSQLIFDGSFFLGLKASKVYVNLSKKEFEQSQRDTRAKVAKAYYSCLVTARNYQILKKNVQQVEQTLFETRQRYKNGVVEQLDVDRQQLTLQTLENQLSKVKREKKVARKLLKFQMGYPVKDSIRLSGKLETELPDFKNKRAVPDNFKPQKRLSYQQLNVREKLATLNKKRYKAEYLPTINAFATHLQLAQRDDFNFFDGGEPWFPSTYAGISINFPIFNGFRRSAKLQKAKIELEQVQNRQEKLKAQIWVEVNRAKRTYNNALQRAQKQQQNLELARKIFQQSKTKYEEGVGSSLELTTAQNKLFEAQTKYIQAVQDYLVAEIDLEKALGTY